MRFDAVPWPRTKQAVAEVQAVIQQALAEPREAGLRATDRPDGLRPQTELRPASQGQNHDCDETSA